MLSHLSKSRLSSAIYTEMYEHKDYSRADKLIVELNKKLSPNYIIREGDSLTLHFNAGDEIPLPSSRFKRLDGANTTSSSEYIPLSVKHLVNYMYRHNPDGTVTCVKSRKGK